LLLAATDPVMSFGRTPHSSSSIARTRTAAVIWHSFVLTPRPLTSSGRPIPEATRT
jgi:hypothetical protein